ncbi:autophagy-related protein 13a-like [Prosopis cineraria]|uniref:autophagy-related protein 13a-like n=1 Tax=Prosopis cineraria TaxID=364024 RepID=UPI00241023E7|nr:autophagy-related protein 13a-like [Prosopis cineraria]
MQSELRKLEHIISHFYSKSLHVIVGSRVPSLYSLDSCDLPTSSSANEIDKWFNLLLGNQPAALDNFNFWRGTSMDPMIIDIVIVRNATKTVIERWVVEYERRRLLAPRTGDIPSDYKKAYQKSIVLFRSLYSRMRLLPAHTIFRRRSSSSHTCNFDITSEVSSFTNPFSRTEEDMMEEYSFTAIEAFPGRFCISVTYRSTLSNLNLEFSTPSPPKLIKDYVGSPNASPLMSLPSVAVELHLRSWTSAFRKAAPLVQKQTIVGSPPICRPCRRTSDFPTDDSGNKIPNYPNLTQQRRTSYGEHRPCTFLPSPSPSSSLSPRPFFSDNPMQTQLPLATVPAAIPLSGMGKGSRNFSPDFSDSSGNSLPLLSPRSTKNDNSLHKSSSRIRSSTKIEAHRAGGVHSRTVNSGVRKIVRDNKDDSRRFSGSLPSRRSLCIGLSRSSSKLSFQDDFDDWDVSYPFHVDDVDMLGFQPSQNVDDDNTSEITSKALPMGRKSQDAAIGALLCKLRAAPPLPQDPSCVPSQSLKTETEEDIATGAGVFGRRKMADALEELRSYRKIRDHLLSESEIGGMSKYED